MSSQLSKKQKQPIVLVGISLILVFLLLILPNYDFEQGYPRLFYIAGGFVALWAAYVGFIMKVCRSSEN